MVALARDEIDQRVAVLRKLREALLKQRDRFRRYLNVLEHEEQDIINEDVDKLTAHVELEQSIVREINAVQKVIDPLEDMYRAAYPEAEDEIPRIRSSLDHLREQVLQRNKQNQDLLRRHMTELRRKILDVKNNRKAASVYAPAPPPSLVDIQT